MRTILAICLGVAWFSATVAPARSESAQTDWPVACENCAADEAVLVVRLPEDARLFVNDRATTTTGAVRHFVDRKMDKGRPHRYRLRAEVTIGDRTARADRVVHLLAGEALDVNIEFGPESLDGHPTPADDAQDEPPTEDAVELPGNAPVTTIVLHVPEDARVFLEDVETTETGTVREFHSTHLSAGQEWTDYAIRVVAERDGRMVSREKKINLIAGETRELRFDLDGPATVESAIAAGLAWLVENQNEDGSWSLHLFGDPKTGVDPDGKARSREMSDSAATALALLPLLRAGHTHVESPYSEAIGRGLAWLVEHQAEDGCLRAGSSDKAAMYAHGQATIVLCEALARSGDENLREPSQKAVDYIVGAQNVFGGWRYQPREPGDLSVTGWQVMALKSAEKAGLRVPRRTLETVGRFLDRVEGYGGAQYSYIEGARPTYVMTAGGLLCRIYLGWEDDHPTLLRGADWLIENHPPSAEEPNIYYWYHATPVMRYVGGERWENWNRAMSRLLIEMQQQPGGDHPEHAGSWAPQGGRSTEGGRLYMTALAACTLEDCDRTVLPERSDLRWGQPKVPSQPDLDQRPDAEGEPEMEERPRSQWSQPEASELPDVEALPPLPPLPGADLELDESALPEPPSGVEPVPSADEPPIGGSDLDFQRLRDSLDSLRQPETQPGLDLPKLPAEATPLPGGLDLDAIMPPTQEAQDPTPEK